MMTGILILMAVYACLHLYFYIRNNKVADFMIMLANYEHENRVELFKRYEVHKIYNKMLWSFKRLKFDNYVKVVDGELKLMVK